jgi:hypothetical protein
MTIFTRIPRTRRLASSASQKPAAGPLIQSDFSRIRHNTRRHQLQAVPDWTRCVDVRGNESCVLERLVAPLSEREQTMPDCRATTCWSYGLGFSSLARAVHPARAGMRRALDRPIECD